MEQSLTIDQRAQVVGDEGICPICEEEVSWKDIDTNWYICKTCVGSLMDDKPQPTEDDLRAVLKSMIESNDPFLSRAQEIINELKQSNPSKLKITRKFHA